MTPFVDALTELVGTLGNLRHRVLFELTESAAVTTWTRPGTS